MPAESLVLPCQSSWTLRAINSAQSTYVASCGGRFYATSVISLGTDLNTAPSVKTNYTLALTAGAPAGANPIQQSSRHHARGAPGSDHRVMPATGGHHVFRVRDRKECR